MWKLFSMGKDVSPTMRDSVMYKLSYYRFGQITTEMVNLSLTKFSIVIF